LETRNQILLKCTVKNT